MCSSQSQTPRFEPSIPIDNPKPRTKIWTFIVLGEEMFPRKKIGGGGVQLSTGGVENEHAPKRARSVDLRMLFAKKHRQFFRYLLSDTTSSYVIKTSPHPNTNHVPLICLHRSLSTFNRMPPLTTEPVPTIKSTRALPKSITNPSATPPLQQLFLRCAPTSTSHAEQGSSLLPPFKPPCRKCQ